MDYVNIVDVDVHRRYGRLTIYAMMFAVLVCGFFSNYNSIGICCFGYQIFYLTLMMLPIHWGLKALTSVFLFVGFFFSMPKTFVVNSADWIDYAAVAGLQLGHAFILFGVVTFHNFMNTYCDTLPAYYKRQYLDPFCVFCYPIVGCSCYAVMNVLSPFGSQTSLAYALWEWQSMTQIVNLFGLCSLNFIIILCSAAAAYELTYNENYVRKRPLLIFTTIAFILCWFWGGARLLYPFFYQKGVSEFAPPSASIINVACIEDFSSSSPAARTLAAFTAGYKFVVWSETLYGPLSSSDETSLIQQIESWTTTYQSVALITYTVTTDGDPATTTYYNVQTLIELGTVLHKYLKRHPVPILETSQGVVASLNPIPTSFSTVLGTRVMTAICFDFDFPDDINYFDSQSKPSLMVQSANTWGIIGETHARSSAFRGVESGAYFMRCGAEGPSGLWDPRGNVMAYQTRFDAGTVSMQMPYGIPGTFSIYELFGFCFEYITYALTGVYLFMFGHILYGFRQKRTSLLQDDTPAEATS